MLSKRFKYNGKPATRLNELQVRMKKQIERKIEEGIYSFEEVPCCVCGGKNFEILSEKDRYGLYVPVVICRACGLIQTNPRMTQKAYNRFYDMEQKKLYVGKDIPTDKYFESQYERGTRIYAYIEKNLRIDLTDLKVLEVGTGAGGILYAFKEKGNEVYGCDLASEYIAFGKKKYNLDLQIGTIYDSNINWTSDIVIYSHTLEHILNPVEELIKLKSICGSNTYLYIELPGVKYLTHSYDTNFLKQLQNAHVYYFTLTTLKNLLRKAGWDFVCGTEVIYSIFKPSSSSEGDYENDYDNIISFLRRMVFYRFMPTPYNVKRLTMPTTISFLKRAGLYNTAKRIYHKFKA